MKKELSLTLWGVKSVKGNYVAKDGYGYTPFVQLAKTYDKEGATKCAERRGGTIVELKMTYDEETKGYWLSEK